MIRQRRFNLSDWALNHRSFVWFLLIISLVAGTISYNNLGREEDPNFTIKIMVISAALPGATVEETLKQVTTRIETKLEELDEPLHVREAAAAELDVPGGVRAARQPARLHPEDLRYAELVGALPRPQGAVLELRLVLDGDQDGDDVAHLRRAPALALSGGERRRCEIARALATHPSYILLDEPLAGIDPIAVGEIRDLVKHLKDRGIGVLITDHNVRETLEITDRVSIISGGSVLFEGTADEAVADPEVRRVYLGEMYG